MNREAAALGVPVYSIFRGKIGAVDNYLAEQGRMILVENVQDVRTKIIVRRWKRPSHPDTGGRPALRFIVDSILAVLAKRDPRLCGQVPLSAGPDSKIHETEPTVLQS